MITARDIAEQVGVSISTVGRALADDPRISSETKTKVRRAAERAGYVGNMPARVVRGGTSNLVGLLVPEVRNDFYATIAQALSEACDQAGSRLVLSLTGDDRDVEARHIRELAGARAAGIIIVPTTAPRRTSVQILQTVPHVQLLRRVPSLNDVWFGIDDTNAMLQATQHLVALGHRRIGYIGGTEALSTGTARVEGFRRACREAGLANKDITEALGAPSHAFGAEALRKILASPRPPTAIVAGSVNITMGLIETVETMGLAVPEALSLVGFGDPEWFRWWRGGVTTIRPPVENLATSCGLWFLDRIRTRDRNGSVLGPHNALVSSSFLVRKTTRAPAGLTKSVQPSSAKKAKA